MKNYHSNKIELIHRLAEFGADNIDELSQKAKELSQKPLNTIPIEKLQQLAKKITFLQDETRIKIPCQYGRILPKLEPLNHWAIEELPVASVMLPQKVYQKKLSTKQIEAYKDWKLSRGLVIKENGGYRVVDGYHRTQAAKNQKLETSLFLVGCCLQDSSNGN